MSRCARCGAELRANSKWCLACGEGVEGSDEWVHSAPTAEFEFSLTDETITEAHAQLVLPAPVEAKSQVEAVTLETIPEEPLPTEPDFGNDTIAATVPIPSTDPPDPPAPATLQQSRPATAAAKGRKPVPVALLLLPLIFVALASAAAYYVLTRESSRKSGPAPVRKVTRQAAVKSAPTPAQPAAQPAAIETVTQSLETQGPPAPRPELEVPSPVPPKEENRKTSSSRGSKKTTAPEPEPLPEAESAPEEPQPVDPMAVVEPGPGVTSAELVYRAPLRLPLRARIRRVRGRASVEVIVKTDGTPESPALIESSGNEIFDRAAMSAAMQCRFAPGIRNGERVRTRARIDYSNVSTPQ